MPFTDIGRPIIRLFEGLGQGNRFAIQADIVHEDAMVDRVASGDQAGAVGRADRTGRNGRGEQDALGRQAIQMRRPGIGIARAAQGLGTPLVRQEKDDVGSPRPWVGCLADSNDQNGDYQNDAGLLSCHGCGS